jgi:hypothetical protein
MITKRQDDKKIGLLNLKCSKAIASSFTLEAAAIISLAVAAIYWIDSVYLFIIITIDSAYGQTISLPPSPEPVTPFKKWYDEQKEKAQLGENTLGENQTIQATVHDAITDEQIENAIVELKVTADDISTGNIIEEFSDQDGDISYTWELEEDSTEPGTYIATVQASADGYQSSSKTATFEVIEENGVQQDEDVEGNNDDITDDEEDCLLYC